MKKNSEDPFSVGDFIKHDKFLDVALQIDYASRRGDCWLVTGYWWNQGFEKSWMVPYENPQQRRGLELYSSDAYGPHSQTIKIKHEDLSKWLKLKTPPRSQCLRRCEWESVV